MSQPEPTLVLTYDAVTPEIMADVLKRTGYRANLVENARGPQIQSAAQGMGFIVSFGNPGAGGEGSYADFAFQCWIGVQGELPQDLITSWNSGMRFARVFLSGEFLVLSMDVMVAGGVTENHLIGQCELWDRVIRDFILHLRRPATTVAQEAR